MDGAGIGGEAMRGSVFIAKRFELRSCRHKPSMTSAECIKDLIGADNLNHYGVAGQDLELRKALREILGVPLLFINRGLLLMEDPSRATREHAHRVEKQKLGMNEFEKKTLSALPTGEAVGGMIDGAGRKKKTTEAKKKKKAKKGKSQPNSLSRKKSARPVEKLAAPSASESKQHKPKRQRRPKKRTCNHASGETASNPNAAVE